MKHRWVIHYIVQPGLYRLLLACLYGILVQYAYTHSMHTGGHLGIARCDLIVQVIEAKTVHAVVEAITNNALMWQVSTWHPAPVSPHKLDRQAETVRQNCNES